MAEPEVYSRKDLVGNISAMKNILRRLFFISNTNSQKHGITKDFSTYPYSSYLSLLSDKPTLLKREEVMDWFGNKKEFINFHKGNMENLIEYSKENEYLKELERSDM